MSADTDIESEAWDAVGTGRWMHREDRERLECKLERKRRRGVVGDRDRNEHNETIKHRDIRHAYRDLGRPPTAVEVAARGQWDIRAENYRIGPTWDETLRAAGVPAVVDTVAEWISARQATPERSASSFSTAEIAADVPASLRMVSEALGRLRDGIAVSPAVEFRGRVVERRRGANAITWGIDAEYDDFAATEGDGQ